MASEDHMLSFNLGSESFQPLKLNPGFDEKFFANILVQLTDQDVSDIHIETNLPIWIRRFGAQRRLTERALTQHELTKIVTWLYASSNAMGELAKIHDINKKYNTCAIDGTTYSYRLNAVNSTQTGGAAVRIALRPIPKDLPTLEGQIDLDPAIREAFIYARGIGFVVGETGNGKSTLLAALNRDLILTAPNRKLLTWESPVEFDLFRLNEFSISSHVSQHEIGESVKTFYDGIVNSLRSAPTDILVGESKDRLTLDATLHSGETGHKTNTTIHAGSVRDTFLRIASEYPPAEQAGIIYKTLVNTNFVLVQKLMERPGGGRRYPLREWFIFDDEIRRELLSFDDVKAALTRLDEMVVERGQDFYSQSKKAYAEGKISAEAAKVFDTEQRKDSNSGVIKNSLGAANWTQSVDDFGLNVQEQQVKQISAAREPVGATKENQDELIRTISSGFSTIAATIEKSISEIGRNSTGFGVNAGNIGFGIERQPAQIQGFHDQRDQTGNTRDSAYQDGRVDSTEYSRHVAATTPTRDSRADTSKQSDSPEPAGDTSNEREAINATSDERRSQRRHQWIERIEQRMQLED